MNIFKKILSSFGQSNDSFPIKLSPGDTITIEGISKTYKVKENMVFGSRDTMLLFVLIHGESVINKKSN